MRKTIIGMALVLVVVPLSAQERGGPGREALRRAVVERFVQNYTQQAGLTEEQRDQFGQALQRHFRQRQELAMRRRQILRGIEEQMRPGVAADADSVAALVEGLLTLDEESAAAARSEQEAYAAFLSPVQRGLLVVHNERLQRQIQNVQRRQGQPPRRNNPSGNQRGLP